MSVFKNVNITIVFGDSSGRPGPIGFQSRRDFPWGEIFTTAWQPTAAAYTVPCLSTASPRR